MPGVAVAVTSRADKLWPHVATTVRVYRSCFAAFVIAIADDTSYVRFIKPVAVRAFTGV